MERVERRCSVCGTLLYYTTTDRRVGPVFCPDRPCMLYPPVSTSRAEDPTLPGLCMAIIETVPRVGSKLARALGKSPNSYAGAVARGQRERWKDFT
jgi:hypothetical protein